MTDVQFQEDAQTSRPSFAPPGTRASGLSGLLISWKLAKNEKDATMVLIGAFIVAVFVTGFLFWQMRGNKKAPHIPPAAPGFPTQNLPA